MSEAKSHGGGCHCGAVRYEVEIDVTAPVIACNCSMCGRSGTLLSFVPSSQFVLRSGGDALTDYRFNRHLIHHVFCKVCGIKPFARGRTPNGDEMVAINVRCLDDVDLDALTVKHVDGKSR